MLLGSALILQQGCFYNVMYVTPLHYNYNFKYCTYKICITLISSVLV